jgi:hypothetical protein
MSAADLIESFKGQNTGALTSHFQTEKLFPD